MELAFFRMKCSYFISQLSTIDLTALSCKSCLCVWRGTAKQRTSIEKQPSVFTVYLPNLQSFKLRICASNCVFLFFFPPKAKYEQYQGPHLFLLLSGLAYPHPASLSGTAERESERGLNVEERACSCFFLQFWSIMCPYVT